MNTTNTTQNRDYSVRPSDVKHVSLDAIIAEAEHERQRSKEAKYVLGDMRAVADGDSVKIASPRGVARFTHWSFGQLAKMVGAPASYLRQLPARIAADAINYGLHEATPHSTPAVLLVRAANGSPEPVVRSVTTKTYGRLFDADLLSTLRDLVARNGWELDFATRSDRDSIVTISNKRNVLRDPSVQSIVNDPDTAAGGIMYRSLTVGNSEVGAGSAWYEGGLYRARCKNLMLWSAVIETRYRRRHVGTHVLRDVARELARFAHQYLEQSPERDEAIIRQLIERDIASTKDGVVAELRAFGATIEQANAAFAACEMFEPARPTSYWGIAQGMTRNSQAADFSDERIALDSLAAQVLRKGARQLVAA